MITSFLVYFFVSTWSLLIYHLIIQKGSDGKNIHPAVCVLPSLQTHHMYSMLKRHGDGRYHVVSTWNTRGVFVRIYNPYTPILTAKTRIFYQFSVLSVPAQASKILREVSTRRVLSIVWNWSQKSLPCWHMLVGANIFLKKLPKL